VVDAKFVNYEGGDMGDIGNWVMPLDVWGAGAECASQFMEWFFVEREDVDHGCGFYARDFAVVQAIFS
jgi:hypothetical protein